jgi:glycyl-tRNA synthetase beta chain
MPELILELFSEEIPAQMQAKASDDLTRLITDQLKSARLPFGTANAYATPRRLTLHIQDIAWMTESTREESRGPREGAPEKALEGFLRNAGVTRDQLELRDDKKGRVYFAVVEKPAQQAVTVLADIVPAVVTSFPWPKSMRWGSGDLRWVRPLRHIACVLTDGQKQVVPTFKIGGVALGAITFGHRFMAPEAIEITSFAQYTQALARAFVTLDPKERADKILSDAHAIATKLKLELVSDPELLREVAGLVEHPVVLSGKIDAEFQALPPEVLQTSMRAHQKFFSLREPRSGKITRFITVANVATKDNGARIVTGNERVLRARLADARFFYANDLAVPLEERLPALGRVTFHNRIGSQADRIRRLRALATAIAPIIGCDTDHADRAAFLAKADLVSEMVHEFPELQGLMGRYYAEAAGEPPAVAHAIEHHYAPLGPTDDVPTDPVAITVALADKLDQLAAFWAIDAKPTGSGDPFALRRAALGVIRIILDNGIRIKLGDVLLEHAARLETDLAALAKSQKSHGAPANTFFTDATNVDLLRFFAERLKVFLRSQGVQPDIVDAIYALAAGQTRHRDDLVEINARIQALSELIAHEDGVNLLAAFKRANNILLVEEQKDCKRYSEKPNPNLAQKTEEKDLFDALATASAEIDPALKAEDFQGAMTAMAKLRAPLDAFFDNIIVNADDDILRANRLRLLHLIKTTMLKAADFSMLKG